MSKQVIIKLDLREDFLAQFEKLGDEVYGEFLEAMDKAGWYNGDDMEEAEQAAAEASEGWWLVAVELHRQAHPGGPSDPLMCRHEPCRSLPLHMTAGQPPVCAGGKLGGQP